MLDALLQEAVNKAPSEKSCIKIYILQTVIIVPFDQPLSPFETDCKSLPEITIVSPPSFLYTANHNLGKVS